MPQDQPDRADQHDQELECLPVDQVARLFFVQPPTVLGWIADGRCEAINIGGAGHGARYRVPRSAIRKLRERLRARPWDSVTQLKDKTDDDNKNGHRQHGKNGQKQTGSTDHSDTGRSN